jgi:hypothetical protein
MYNPIERQADKFIKQMELMKKLSDIAGRKDYPGKIRRIREKLVEEINLFERKNPSQRLEDLKKDLTFIELQRDAEEFDKERIDLLIDKYSISYGKSSKTY